MTYTSYADLGGQPGYGRVLAEQEGELFHASWEPRALALTIAMGATGSWSIDMSRSARETLVNYHDLSYYEIWVHALQKLLENRGLVEADEIEQGKMIYAPKGVKRVLHAGDVATTLAKGSPMARLAKTPARYKVGQSVRTHNNPVPHHTRLPGYARGKLGIIETVHGAHVFADANAQGSIDHAEWLYTVVFDGRDVWGDEAPAQRLKISVDAWEPYLEPA